MSYHGTSVKSEMISMSVKKIQSVKKRIQSVRRRILICWKMSDLNCCDWSYHCAWLQ